jgi:hypothetical protein
MTLPATVVEQHIVYDRACNKLYNIAKLFEKAADLLQEGKLYEDVNNVRAKAKEVYGEQRVAELDATARKRLDDEIVTCGTGMTPLTCMWFIVALTFAHHPIDSYTDMYGYRCIHDDGLWAQVYHATGGNIGAWQENA